MKLNKVACKHTSYVRAMNKQGSVKHDGQIKHIELHLNLSAVCGHYYVSNNMAVHVLFVQIWALPWSHDYAHVDASLSDTVREKVIHFEPCLHHQEINAWSAWSHGVLCMVTRCTMHGHTVYVVYYGKV